MNQVIHIQKKIGERIRFLRIKHNISQEELEKLSGIHRSTISEIEHGKKNLSLKHLYLLAVAFQIEIQELFD